MCSAFLVAIWVNQFVLSHVKRPTIVRALVSVDLMLISVDFNWE